MVAGVHRLFSDEGLQVVHSLQASLLSDVIKYFVSLRDVSEALCRVELGDIFCPVSLFYKPSMRPGLCLELG